MNVTSTNPAVSESALSRALPEAVAILDSDQSVGVMLSPLRRRMLALLQEDADSAVGLARRLDQPRQKVNYHLRQLENAGFVELVSERRRRGCTERSFRPTARAYLLSSELLGELAADPADLRDRFSSSYLLALAGRLVQELTSLRQRAAAAGKRLPTLAIETEVRFANAHQRAEFAEELTETVARLAAKYQTDADENPGSRAYRFVVAGLPVTQPPAAAKPDEEPT